MRHRQGGQHRQPHIQEGQTGRGRNREHQGHHNDEAHGVKHGNTDDQAGQHQRPVYPLQTESPDQFFGNVLGRAAVRHQLSQHGAKTEDHHQGTQRGANAFLDGIECVQYG